MLWLVALSALTCARAGGCWYMGRWYAAGATVRVRDSCLRCRCAHGALSCARATCAPAPDPPPRRCALLHRRDACCPELHCPDEVRTLELEATSRAEEEGVVTPAASAHACSAEGAVFAAGSALSSARACEQCFCLRGARRCVRPRCLPPPAGCAPRPAAGACCPARYYCHNDTTAAPTTPSSTPATTHHPHDCLVNGSWVREGERVARGACASCFCLRGGVRCQPLHCAPALHGCIPLLRDGHCCPHQYHCPQHTTGSEAIIESISDNALVSTRYEERSLSASAPAGQAAAPPAPPALPAHNTRSSPSTSPATTKVKRKTNDPPPANVSRDHTQNKTETISTSTTTETVKENSVSKSQLESSSPAPSTTSVNISEKTSTEQPESSVRVIINGTINCTAELSSARNTTTTLNDTAATSEAEWRVADVGGGAEAEGEGGDIITQRPLEEGDSFTINVTSSLFPNKSLAPAPSPAPTASPAPAPPTASTTQLVEETNISKSVKDDYDYDYTEPTLPPSLPNLKIIPFVAADAVLDDDASKASESYPAAAEDKFPVYYPEAAPATASRREDVFAPAQYPVFPSPPPPAPTPSKPVSSPATTTSNRKETVAAPSVNLFSPPVETEGGFIPKGPGIIDEYYAVYPSTPHPAPHLTTSMQINPHPSDTGECMTSDGRRVSEGESVWVSCSVCACAWGELSCAPRPCRTPAPCRRRAPSATHHDICCGELVCDHDNTTSSLPTLPTRGTEITLNVTKVPVQLQSELIPFEPPPDRSVPPAPAPTTTPPSTQRTSTAAALETTRDQITTDQVDALSATALPIDDNNLNATSDKAQHSISNTTEKLTSVTATVTPSTPQIVLNKTESPVSQEYEEEDEDEGFSFGSVLKLLLSDSYHSTTTTKAPSTSTVRAPPFLTSKKPASTLTSAPFIPIPQQTLYAPTKRVPQPTAVNRIDHLVLGEATAIKRTTPRPLSTSTRPPTTRRFTLRTTTRKATTTVRPVTRTEKPLEQHTSPPVVESARPAVGGGGGGVGAGAGLLKLAGCNIYGRMYRVGRIIAELSTPCQECRCTELGVQCAPLRC